MAKVNAKKTPAPPTLTRRGEQRREAFLEAAREVFMEKGYLAASIDDVVGRVGGSKASVYQYFGSKDGLFGAMIEAQCQLMLDEVAIPAQVEDDLEKTLIKLAHRAMRLFLSPERLRLHRAMIAAAGQFPELAQRMYESGPQRGMQSLSVFFARQHEAGLMVCPDAELAAIHFMNIVRSFPVFRMLLGLAPMPPGRALDAFLRDAVRTFLYGCTRPI